MPEHRSTALTRPLLIEELRAVLDAMIRHGFPNASVSFGWDSNLDFDDMWKAEAMPTQDVLGYILLAEQNEIVEIGKADIFVEGESFRFTLCHESDAHVKGDSSLSEEILKRWRDMGYSPYEIPQKPQEP